MSARRVLLSTALFAGLALAGCSSGSANSDGDNGSPAATADTTGGSSTTTTVAVSVTIAPAPAATSPKPKPVTTPPAPAGPQLANVALSGYPGGITCTPGDVLNITLTFTTTGAAGVLIWSSAEGNIGQFPAEFGQAEVPYTCSASATLFTLYPVAEGGELGTPVNLDV